MSKRAVRILKAGVGVESNTEKLLPYFPLGIEVKSLLTDFKEVEEIPYSPDLDGYISVYEDKASGPSVELSPNMISFRGPLTRLAKEASDARFTLWGNQGFLFRYVLFLLEKKHSIYNFHGCALYDNGKHRLYLIIGGAGSGKTVYLLSGINKGLKLFSTEIVHFRIGEGIVEWFMGSLVDNVRFGTLRHDFPRFMPDVEIPEEQDEWAEKIALDLSIHKTDKEILTDPELAVVFPRIEEGRDGFLLRPVEKKRKAVKLLFDNVSQKLSETVILYDTIPVVGFDDRELAMNRLHSIEKLIKHPTVKTVASVLSNPYECWGNI